MKAVLQTRTGRSVGCGSVVQGLPTMCKTLVLVTGGGERIEEEKGKGERETILSPLQMASMPDP